MQEIEVKVAKHAHRRFYVMWYVDPVTEKPVQRTTKKTTLREAERVAARWEDELRSGRQTADWRIEWDAFRDRYNGEKLASLSNGMQVSTDAALNHLERVLAPKRLRGVTADALSRFQAALRAEGMADTTIACHLRHIRAALSWAESVGLLPDVPKIKMPKRAKGRTMMRGRPITTEEFERMLTKVPKVRKLNPEPWHRYLRGLWLSGLRLEESLIVSWDADAAFSVDLTGKRPHFRIYAEAHKGGRDERLAITPDFAEFLLATPEADRHGPLFPLNVCRHTAGRVVSAIGRIAGVVVNKDKDRYATAHDLRRSFGTRWAPKVKPAMLQRLMRHRNIETTLRYYVALDADEMADELWAAYNPITKPDSAASDAAAEEETSAEGHWG